MLKDSFVVVTVVLLHAILCSAYARAGSAVDLFNSGVVTPLSVSETAKLVTDAESGIADAAGWAEEILSALKMGGLPGNKENVCAVIAVTGQESSFQSNPVVPGLGKIATNEIVKKLEFLPFRMASPIFDFLNNYPRKDRSFLKRIRAAKTEKDLDRVFRDLVGFVTSKLPSGIADSFAEPIDYMNEIDTIGAMQVAVRFAIDQVKASSNKPLTLRDIYTLRDLMYTRKGGLYYGALQLLGYESGYSQKIFRFADFNAGRYTSRNAAFQFVIASLVKSKLSRDGDLLAYSSDGVALRSKSQTESILFMLSKQHQMDLSEVQIRMDLLLEKKAEFRQTKTYKLIRQVYSKVNGLNPPTAMLPDIELHSGKINAKRKMSTAVFATSVNRRYQQCMGVV